MLDVFYLSVAVCIFILLFLQIDMPFAFSPRWSVPVYLHEADTQNMQHYLSIVVLASLYHTKFIVSSQSFYSTRSSALIFIFLSAFNATITLTYSLSLSACYVTTLNPLSFYLHAQDLYLCLPIIYTLRIQKYFFLFIPPCVSHCKMSILWTTTTSRMVRIQ